LVVVVDHAHSQRLERVGLVVQFPPSHELIVGICRRSEVTSDSPAPRIATGVDKFLKWVRCTVDRSCVAPSPRCAT
jgi:hypothetical protein